jgi:RNA polymerase sigma-70 factor, ECF subfamily
MAPTESVASVTDAEMNTAASAVDRTLLAELWRACDAAGWGLAREEFGQILQEVGAAWNFGLAADATATPHQQAAYFRALCLADLVLARACAGGNERAWEHFVAIYRQPLLRAAISITGSETLGHDLADLLYAELYGLKELDGERRCPLLSYRGRGSLLGWLRTTLAQRHVDHHRRTRREQPIEEFDAPAAEPAPETPARELSMLERAIEEALGDQPPEECYLLSAHYLDEQTLKQIAKVLGVHEATVSRKLQRALKGIRKSVFGNLLRGGLSRRTAEEAMGADPRDLDVNLKKLLQDSQVETFKEQAIQ